MERIDAHCHVVADHADSKSMLDSLELRLLNIALGTDPVGRWREDGIGGSEVLARTAAACPARCAWVTAFDEPRPGDPGWADAVVAGLERDFARGAVAVKVWKNIGLKVRNPGGGSIMPDDPVFWPVYSWLESRGGTLVMHVGEAVSAWKPLDPASPHYGHYSRNPDQHLHRKKDIPGHAELIAARDRIMERHPRLRLVGCHLGSLEHDVREVADRLDRYPNFAVDTSARVLDLAMQDHGLVQEFFHKYQDRILWGTDVFTEKPHSLMDPGERKSSIADLVRRWSEDLAYYESPGEVSFLGWQDRPWKVRGLGLPAGVCGKFFRGNAMKWYPALAGVWPISPPSS